MSLTGSSSLKAKEKKRMKSTADVLVMVYLKRQKGLERAFNDKMFEPKTYKLIVMKSKLQFESPISSAVAKAR